MTKTADPSTTDEQKTIAINFSSFIDPRLPWVLVKDGNFGGYFTFVPEKLRVGDWHSLAMPTILLVAYTIFHNRPSGDEFNADVASYPEAFSRYWWYNLSALFLMTATLTWSISLSSKGILIAYTIMSWNMNAFRHGINALAPFLSDNHPLLTLNHILRFPALVSSTITFVVWNFVLFPYINFKAMKTKEKRIGFLSWNFNPRLVQFHFCNIIYSVLNTMVTGTRETISPPLFDEEDIWYGVAYGFGYGLFYILILDRIGMHMYPIFSPRSNIVLITWVAAFFLHYVIYQFWNFIISEHLESLNFNRLLALVVFFTAAGSFIHSWAKSKKSGP